MIARCGFAFAFGCFVAAFPGLTEARTRCPPGVLETNGKCQANFQAIEPRPRSLDTMPRQRSGWVQQGGDSFGDAQPGWRSNVRRPPRSFDDGGPPLPRLNRGEHYEVINGRVMRVDDRTGRIKAVIGLAPDGMN